MLNCYSNALYEQSEDSIGMQHLHICTRQMWFTEENAGAAAGTRGIREEVEVIVILVYSICDLITQFSITRYFLFSFFFHFLFGTWPAKTQLVAAYLIKEHVLLAKSPF